MPKYYKIFLVLAIQNALKFSQGTKNPKNGAILDLAKILHLD